MSITPNYLARRAWMLSEGGVLEGGESTIITRPVGSRILGKCPWPLREQIRVVIPREARTRMYVTDGLSEPFEHQDEYERAEPALRDMHGQPLPKDVGFGMELYIESGDCIPPQDAHDSWALNLLLWLADLVAEGEVSVAKLQSGGGFMSLDFVTTGFTNMNPTYKRKMQHGGDDMYSTLLIRGANTHGSHPDTYKSVKSGFDIVMAQVTILPNVMAEHLALLEGDARLTWLRETTMTRGEAKSIWVATVLSTTM